MTPPQKRHRGRTNSKKACSGDAPSRDKTEPRKRPADKEPRSTQRKRENVSGDKRPKEPHLKATLPGDLYERSGRWWWRTRLPGESKAKARPLKTPETGEAVCDRDMAERIAVQLWEQAACENGTRQLTRDCAEKVERLKAQFLDKIRQLTVIVESANARALAEAQARTEIEARLNAIVHTAGQKTTLASPIQTLNPAAPHPPGQATDLCAQPSTIESAESTVLSNRLHGAAPEPVHASGLPPVMADDADLQPQTGICECCGAEALVSDLETIDSGQLLCPDCIAALRTDVSRIEARDFSAGRV
jgi:hypothetical protein